MPKILSRALRSLAQFYQTPGGTVSPSGIDFAAPIVVTHPVDRIVEVQQGIIINQETTVATGGAGGVWRNAINVQSLMAVQTIADALLELGITNKGPRTEVDMYVLGISAQVDPTSIGNIARVGMSVEAPIHDEDLAGSGRTYLVFFGNTVLPGNMQITASDGYTVMQSNGLGAYLDPIQKGLYDLDRHPVSGINILSQDNGAGVVTFEYVHRIALMARNARPRP